MADKSKIQWCDATINPAYGCSPASPGCANCYAARMAGRLGKMTEGTHRDGKWTGRINLFPERMAQALSWKKPRRIFVGSMTDLFHPAVPYDFLDKVFACMAMARQHEFILLTKRPSRMREYLQSCPESWEKNKGAVAYWANHLGGVAYLLTGSIKQDNLVEASIEGRLNGSVGWPMRHVMLMATIEDQPRADERVPHLMELAGMGWRTGVSVEPMLGPVDLTGVEIPRAYGTCLLNALTGELRGHGTGTSLGMTGKISWTIVGCESGQHARAMNIEWVHNLKDQCISAGVPFFYKQSMQNGKIVHTPKLDGQNWTQFPE
ncbi:DUF5131 family protein [Solidesulfovibrio alcoholivorans]|uniref:DUF5131 family protein n=1 Tax=Solidesulfovibrio alcoholivorans TaxID=81406 RepID=UPI0004979BC4|nr:DUF5131 family protein [Solidesulfovibrio alcoholivorans]